MDTSLTLKIAALIAALAPITLEDIEAVKQAENLGPDVAANIANLKASADAMDDETISLLNAAREQAGLKDT